MEETKTSNHGFKQSQHRIFKRTNGQSITRHIENLKDASSRSAIKMEMSAHD